ncbi:MAG: Asp-tRNA(Asn)/Glu-tRNA(Gln) amidotransferase subunit GatB [Nanoarchaeota archaeon]|nr:Asp-tRNA(Asn)/Glu-tRNA(Gln) amidotransferase subunit GatB [Nanoarchaeota archaeon]
MEKIGLEIHGYLNTKEKLFCNCKRTSEKTKPNTLICPICTSQPGSKPQPPNSDALKKAVQIGLMLNTKINTSPKKLVWQRKHYNWPDLPKGYQNTLSGPYAVPIGETGEFLGIKIRELHLEEDPAAWNPETGEIDYNRSGAPLIEIVTEPDFHSSTEVAIWLKQLILTLSYIKALDKNAGIKSDVNVNISGISERAEIKNVNSISEIVKVIDSEMKRHKKEKPRIMETRRWNSLKNATEPMRKKEQAADYRFISDPDLPAINIKPKYVRTIKKNIPESPKEKLSKLIKKHKIDSTNAKILTKNLELVEFVEQLSNEIPISKYISWLTVELLRVLNYNKKAFDEVEIQVKHFAELINSITLNKITELKAKQLLNEFIPKSFSISKKKEIKKIPKKEIENFCKKAIKENPKAVKDYNEGEKNALNFLVGQVMQFSKHRADFTITKEILEKELK